MNHSLLFNLISKVLVAVVVVLSLVFAVRLVGPLQLSLSQTISQKQSLFTATGESEITTAPDQAEVSLGIVVSQPQVGQAQDEANRVIANITKDLVGLGIKKEDIKTQNYSINPQYDYGSSERHITGYSVNAQLRVKIRDFEKLNQAIDISTNYGANQVGGIAFSLSTEKSKKLKKQAREEAIKNAKDTASELARLSGVKLGKVVDVQESRAGGIRPMIAKAELAFDGVNGAEPTSIEPGSTTYNYSVTLSYETL